MSNAEIINDFSELSQEDIFSALFFAEEPQKKEHLHQILLYKSIFSPELIRITKLIKMTISQLYRSRFASG